MAIEQSATLGRGTHRTRVSDMMTPAKNGVALARAIPNARVVMLKGAGHMLMSERPDEVLEALRVLASEAGGAPMHGIQQG